MGLNDEADWRARRGAALGPSVALTRNASDLSSNDVISAFTAAFAVRLSD